MRLSALCFLPLAALVLAGCHSTTTAPETRAVASQPSTPQVSASPGSENPAVAASPITRPTKQKNVRSTQSVAQLDLNSEGGVRDGSYAMWVHVSRHGKPLKDLNVVAFNDADKPVAAARTNEDGDAMLKVQATSYRIAASIGHLHKELTVTFHPGDQYELELEP